MLPIRVGWIFLNRLHTLQLRIRSDAPSARRAINQWIKAVGREWARMMSLGPHAYLAHATLEQQCFRQGLIVSESDVRARADGTTMSALAPIDRFLLYGAEDDSPHPLIQPRCGTASSPAL